MEYQQAMNEFTVTVNKTIQEIEQKAQKRGYQAANVLTNEVKKVLSGQRSGRTYKIKGGGTYIASAPGESPAVRTGTLKKSFKRRAYSERNGQELVIHAVTESDLQIKGHLIGELLENGTKRISPRPFKQKTIDAALPKIIQIFQKSYKG